MLPAEADTAIPSLAIIRSDTGVSMDRIGSGHIILLLFFIQTVSDPIKFRLKNFDPYLTRRVTGRPDPTHVK
jgi:hypothetical protein